jgi:hypothetical protein
MSERSEAAEPETGTAKARPFERVRVSRPRREGIARGRIASYRDPERASPFVPAILAFALLLASPGSASEKARSFTIHFAGGSARVVVPKKFEPLLPGSVYPNRRKPIPARGCPVVVVQKVAPLLASAEPFLLERGLLVVEMANPDPVGIDQVLTELLHHAEASPARAELLLWKDSPAINSASITAAAIFDPQDFHEPGAEASRCLPVALFLRAPAATASEELTARFLLRPECVSERWYRAAKGFPEQAFRDAAEWLAAEAH